MGGAFEVSKGVRGVGTYPSSGRSSSGSRSLGFSEGTLGVRAPGSSPRIVLDPEGSPSIS